MDFLAIKQIRDRAFEATDLWFPVPGAPTFGGQIAAQALAAAYNTVSPECHANTLVICFLRPSRPSGELRYTVEKLMDGNTVQWRRVDAFAGDTYCATANISFTKPDVKHPVHSPESLRYDCTYISFTNFITKSLKNVALPEIREECLRNMERLQNVFSIEVSEGRRNMRQLLIRFKQRPASKKEYACGIVLLSDLLLPESALLTANLTMFSKELLFMASMNHSLDMLNLNVPFEGCIYYIVRCESFRESKALCTGQMVHGNGEIICVAKQQVLIRKKSDRK